MQGARPEPKQRVKAFWETEACGERYGAEQDRVRYQLEPEILTLADFPSCAGKRVLEVGVGMGADFLRCVRAGADATGIDLTERAVGIVRRRLHGAGLHAEVRVADAESLPFDSESFDVVYSWGVLHHTPSPPRAMAEACRVLAPGGRLKLMLYHRRSWVALAAWARFCLLGGRPLATLGDAVAHMESPGTKAYTADEVRTMLAGMVEVSVRPTLTAWDRKVAPGLAHLFGDRWGWFLLVQATKPRTSSGSERYVSPV